MWAERNDREPLGVRDRTRLVAFQPLARGCVVEVDATLVVGEGDPLAVCAHLKEVDVVTGGGPTAPGEAGGPSPQAGSPASRAVVQAHALDGEQQRLADVGGQLCVRADATRLLSHGRVPRGLGGRLGVAGLAHCVGADSRGDQDHPLNVPSKELPPNTDLRRAPLLAARVEIEVAAGDLLGARDAADELGRVAAAFESKALTASAAMADGRVRLAAGDITGSRHGFETAVQLWSLVGAPHEVALARTGLAQADRAAGAEAGARPESGPTPSPVEARPIDVGQQNPNVFRLQDRRLLVHFIPGAHVDTA